MLASFVIYWHVKREGMAYRCGGDTRTPCTDRYAHPRGTAGPSIAGGGRGGSAENQQPQPHQGRFSSIGYFFTSRTISVFVRSSTVTVPRSVSCAFTSGAISSARA